MTTKENIAEVTKIGKNILGTISLDFKIKPMRKPQNFSVYPISKGDKRIFVQSDTRFGSINLDGKGLMSKSRKTGSAFIHFQIDKLTPFTIDPEKWEEIKERIKYTSGESVGNSVIKSDNSGAINIFDL